MKGCLHYDCFDFCHFIQ